MTDRSDAPTALVTGAAYGIGAAIAARLAADGFRLALTAEVEPSATLARVNEVSADSAAVVVDLADAGSGTRLVAWAADRFGGLDVVVNCAGITVKAPMDSASDDYFERLMTVNLRAQWEIIRAALPHLDASTRPSVVNVSSIHARASAADFSVYAASKGAINAMTRQLAVELGPRGIRVNAVAPGFIEVERTTADPQHDATRIREQIPARRLGRPEDVAGAVSFLVGPSSAYVNGAVLTVDGGLSAWLPIT